MERKQAQTVRLQAPENGKWAKFKSAFKRQWVFYTMMVPALFLIILLCFVPMPGVILAFKDYSARDGIFGSDWMDPWYKNFEFFFKSDTFKTITFNTIFYNILDRKSVV